MGYEALIEERARNVRLLEVTPELLLELLKVDERKSVSINGRLLVCVSDSIPDSATVQSCGINELGNILLHVADTSFSPVGPGAMVPRISPVYELRAEGGTVVPLYRAPTLADAEREAVAYFTQWGLRGAGKPHAEALRGLLERLK